MIVTVFLISCIIMCIPCRHIQLFCVEGKGKRMFNNNVPIVITFSGCVQFPYLCSPHLENVYVINVVMVTYCISKEEFHGERTFEYVKMSRSLIRRFL